MVQQEGKTMQVKVSDKVLVSLPLKNHALQARYCGPYLVSEKVNNVNYTISTPNRQKSWRLCYVNMLKPYREKAPAQEEDAHPTLMVAVEKQAEEFPPCNDMSGESVKLRNLDILANFEANVQHLSASK